MTKKAKTGTPSYKILSYGGGVQSTALLIASCVGLLEKPEVAIFADTQWGPEDTYAHVAAMTTWAAGHGVEVVTITHGPIRTPRGALMMPIHVLKSDGETAITTRQCTQEFKIDPIRREVRRRLGYRPHQRWRHKTETWLGISVDEAHRMKPSRAHWDTSRWPLIELGMNREDCKRLIEKQGIPVPMKSSCVGCPYHSDKYFLNMKRERPEEWQDVVAFDEWIRAEKKAVFPSLRGEPFVHRSCRPLSEVDLNERQRSLCGEECSGYSES